jgi:L-threonylcarbamoyladenylate synthase
MSAPRILSAMDPAAIPAAVEALRAGGLVAMPTETVYGLAADATNARAVAGVFAAKGRPRFNPLIVHVPDIAAARTIAVFTPEAERLAAAFWPGPLTLVLPKREGSSVADLATAGLTTVAIRIPAHSTARTLLAAFGRPLAAPSANLSGHVSATTAAHVAADLGDEVAIILDAGPASVGIESTIVGLVGVPTLLRSGGLDRAEIESVLGKPLAAAGADIEAPGMLASHYAPKAQLRLNAMSVNRGEALLAFGTPLPGAIATANLSPTRDLKEAAANLFAALRTLDGRATVIAVAPIPNEGLGEAINDRLRRAAAPRP